MSEKVLGIVHTVTKPWFNIICQEALDKRKIARERWVNYADDCEKERIFRVKRKGVYNIIRYEKRTYVQTITKEAEQDYRSHKMRQLYYNMISFKGGYRKQKKCLKNDDGCLVTNQKEIMEKWSEYFEKLFNCENPVDAFTYEGNEPKYDPCSALSIVEIEQQTKRLKNYKSPGEDDLQKEVL